MKKSRYTAEQIIYALKQAEGGEPVGELCRKLGVSEATFYNWRKRYSGMGVSEEKELRQLREENSRLKHMLQEVVAKKL